MKAGPALIRPLEEARLAQVLALNQESALDTSALDERGLRALLSRSCLAVGVEQDGDVQAFLIALDHTAAYDNPNFSWFKARYPTFVYIDRVVTAAEARGRGHGRSLYAHLFVTARQAGHANVVCEVNKVPANPGSDAFHRALGFAPVGEAALANGKIVRYWRADLDA